MPIQAYNTRIFLDEFDLSGQSNSLRLAVDSQSIEYNVFQSPAKQFIAGNPASTLEHDGYYTFAGTSNIEFEMYSRLGTGTTQIAAILGTDQPVQVGYVLPVGYNELLNIDTPVNELITVKGKWSVGSGRMYRGYVLQSGVISATGAVAGIDFATLGTAGGLAWMWMAPFVGTITGATVQVQSDDAVGFASPTTRGTFTFSTANKTLQITLAAVERYLRINTTSLGGATSFHLTVIAGVSGVTY